MAKWYVYELIDPDTNEVFYIGKGTGDRMYQHGKPGDKGNSHKTNKIHKIGYDRVIRRKFAEFWDEQAAYVCESDRICDLYPDGNLTNKVIVTTLANNERKATKARAKSIRKILDFTFPKIWAYGKWIGLETEVKEPKDPFRKPIHDAMLKAGPQLLKSLLDEMTALRKQGYELPRFIKYDGIAFDLESRLALKL